MENLKIKITFLEFNSREIIMNSYEKVANHRFMDDGEKIAGV